MVQAKLFYNKSDKRYLVKELEVVNPSVDEGQTPPEFIDIEILEPCSIKNPRIALSPRTNVLQANYILIPTLARYYYITNPVLDNGRVIVDCKVDVLMSFKDDIMNENVIIDKSNFKHSLYLNDNDMKLYNYSAFQTLEFTPMNSMKFDKSVEQLVMVCSGKH